LEHGGVDARELADKVEGGRVAGRPRGEEARVLAVEAEGGGPREADEGDELLVDLADTISPTSMVMASVTRSPSAAPR
jgi:hypothetical protein